MLQSPETPTPITLAYRSESTTPTRLVAAFSTAMGLFAAVPPAVSFADLYFDIASWTTMWTSDAVGWMAFGAGLLNMVVGGVLFLAGLIVAIGGRGRRSWLVVPLVALVVGTMATACLALSFDYGFSGNDRWIYLSQAAPDFLQLLLGESILLVALLAPRYLTASPA